MPWHWAVGRLEAVFPGKKNDDCDIISVPFPGSPGYIMPPFPHTENPASITALIPTPINQRETSNKVQYKDCLSRYRNTPVSQMRVPLAACHEPAGKLWPLCKVLYITQYLLIHAPFTCIYIGVFWHISNMPHRFRRIKFVFILPCFV